MQNLTTLIDNLLDTHATTIDHAILNNPAIVKNEISCFHAVLKNFITLTDNLTPDPDLDNMLQSYNVKMQNYFIQYPDFYHCM